MVATLALPTTECLLISGGDARIQPDPVSGVSVYGCLPHPDPTLIALGSSTASTISAAGFAAADALRNSCAERLRHQSAFRVYADETERLRATLPRLAIAPFSDSVRVVLAASGTDLHLLVAQWLVPNRIITVAPTETGNGVSAALSGRHFNDRTAYGGVFTVGDALHSQCNTSLVTLSPRHPDGELRTTDEFNAEYAAHVDQAVTAGERVLLVLTDVSKTALILPDITLVRSLKGRWPDQVEVLVDACQFRLAPPTIAAYLAEGWMVALTGSKFIAGPAFCGCLLAPHSVSERYRDRVLHPSVGVYSSAADWPSDWSVTRELPESVNFGLLLRWEAAVTELNAFYEVPNRAAADFLRQFGQAVRQHIATDECLQALSVRELSRPWPESGDGELPWDREQTIFPFLLYQPGNDGIARPLGYDETMQIYQAFLHQTQQTQPRFQFGKPVPFRQSDGTPIGALRLAVSAPMVVSACRDGKLSQMIGNALAALDEVARFVKTM